MSIIEMDVALQQRRDALVRANKVRIAGADIRRQVARMSCADGCRHVAGLIRQPDETVGAMRVGHLLCAIHRVRHTKATEMLNRADVRSHERAIRDMTGRQREKLAEALGRQADRYAFSQMKTARRKTARVLRESA